MGELSYARALTGPSLRWMLPCDPYAIHSALSRAGVAAFYPRFQGWFFGKVIPGVRRGERQIFAAAVDSELVGIAICKRTETERKLCTLWVSPRARGGGIASELASDAFSWLGTTKPLFTVPEERIAEFDGLLRSWSFPVPEICLALYRPERIEYVFNGHICGMA